MYIRRGIYDTIEIVRNVEATVPSTTGDEEMSNAKRQEDRMEKIFVDEIGCKLVEDTGRRKKHQADRVFIKGCRMVVVDHKSTIGETEISLKKAWVDKVREEAKAYNKNAFGVVTVSYKNSHKVLVVMDLDDFKIFMEE